MQVNSHQWRRSDCFLGVSGYTSMGLYRAALIYSCKNLTPNVLVVWYIVGRTENYCPSFTFFEHLNQPCATSSHCNSKGKNVEVLKPTRSSLKNEMSEMDFNLTCLLCLSVLRPDHPWVFLTQKSLWQKYCVAALKTTLPVTTDELITDYPSRAGVKQFVCITICWELAD